MNKSVQVILVSILTLVAVGLAIFTVYYLLSNKDVNKVTTNLEKTTSHASQVDKVPVKELDIKVTLSSKAVFLTFSMLSLKIVAFAGTSLISIWDI